MFELLKNRTIRWNTYIPDPVDDAKEIGDELDLQIIAEIDGRLISGHWELSKSEWLTVIFVPDWLTKDIISADQIDYWAFTRDIT